MNTKIDNLSRVDTEFLSELATHISISYRDYSNWSREKLLNLLANKLNSQDVDNVVKLYLLCQTPKAVAEKVKPDDMFKIGDAVVGFFDNKQYLYEVKVGKRKCDIVFCTDIGVVAIEIKSKHDNVLRAIEQTEYYKQWANNVYLVFDERHEKRVMRSQLMNNGVGLIKYSKNDVRLIKDASYHKTEPYDLLMWMTYEHLAKIAKHHRVCVHGSKKDIIMRLVDRLPSEILRELFHDYLKARASG